MSWLEPRFVITLLLIGLFGFAYLQDPSDQAMKGAIIAAFSAAYGFWIGSKGNEKAAENTGEAFRAIQAAASAGTSHDTPQPVEAVNPPDNLVPVEQPYEGPELPDFGSDAPEEPEWR